MSMLPRVEYNMTRKLTYVRQYEKRQYHAKQECTGLVAAQACVGELIVSREIEKAYVVNPLKKSGHEVWQRNGVMWHQGELMQGREKCQRMLWTDEMERREIKDAGKEGS